MNKMYKNFGKTEPDLELFGAEETSGDVVEPAPTVPTKKTVEVTAERLNVRTSPSMTSMVKCVVCRGESLEIRADDKENNGFLPIKTNIGVIGWVSKTYVK